MRKPLLMLALPLVLAFLSTRVDIIQSSHLIRLLTHKMDRIPLKKFIIRRNIPGAGNMTPSELVKAGCGSMEANEKSGNKCVWIHSYIVGDGTFCLYAAPSMDAIKEHAKCAKMDASEITEVLGILDTTGAYLRHATCD
jgi:hypothetical protein